MEKNLVQIKTMKRDCNGGKVELMQIQLELYQINAKKEAEELGEIIEKLDAWQKK